MTLRLLVVRMFVPVALLWVYCLVRGLLALVADNKIEAMIYMSCATYLGFNMK